MNIPRSITITLNRIYFLISQSLFLDNLADCIVIHKPVLDKVKYDLCNMLIVFFYSYHFDFESVCSLYVFYIKNIEIK